MKWISIKSKLPKDNDIVLVIRKKRNTWFVPEVVSFKDGHFCFLDPEAMDEGVSFCEDIITHWMYLPEPPKN